MFANKSALLRFLSSCVSGFQANLRPLISAVLIYVLVMLLLPPLPVRANAVARAFPQLAPPSLATTLPAPASPRYVPTIPHAVVPRLHAAPATTIGNVSTITANFDGKKIEHPHFVWFNSIAKVHDAPAGATTKIFVRSAYITFAANGRLFNLAVPDATIILSPDASGGATSYDPVTNSWTTTAPSGFNNSIFLTGLPFVVPEAGLPGGLNPVSWTATFYTDRLGISLHWKWAGIAYSNFSLDNNALGVKAIDHLDPTGGKNNLSLGGNTAEFCQRHSRRYTRRRRAFSRFLSRQRTRSPYQFRQSAAACRRRYRPDRCFE
jgi:hypothetical protein